MGRKDLDEAEEILGEIQNITLDVDDGVLLAETGIKMIQALIDDYTEEGE